MKPRMSGIADVARGSDQAGRSPSAAMSASKRPTELPGLAQDVVVDIGDVSHALGVVPEVAEPPLQDVIGQIRRGVSHVRRVVRGDPAGVHLHDRPGLERDDRPASGVVKSHGFYSSRRAGRPVKRTAAWVL